LRMFGWMLVSLVLGLPLLFIAYIMYRRDLMPRSKYTSRIFQDDRPSFTAEMVCFFRAIGQELKWCHDPFAYYILDWDARFLTTMLVALFKALGGGPRFGMIIFVAARTEYLDKFIKSAPKLEQLVILGAGLDARAYRMKYLLGDGVRIFEVDAPATQKMKIRKMEEIAKEHPKLFGDVKYDKYVTFVSCDFVNESFVDKLKEKGFDTTNSNTTVILEGVASYLTPEAFAETLRRVGTFAPGTRLALNIPDKKRQISTTAARLKFLIREEWRNGWEESVDPKQFYGQFGFKVTDARTFAAMAEDFPQLPKNKTMLGYMFAMEVT